ncbi:MAG: cupin domain-containing protein [Nitrospiria bacterium]
MADSPERPTYHETFAGGAQIIRWPHAHPLPEAEVLAFFSARRIQSTRWSNDPCAVYEGHEHAYRKMLFCLVGGITFSLEDGRDVTLAAGDRLIIPAGMRHGARVGPQGVVCIEGADSS